MAVFVAAAWCVAVGREAPAGHAQSSRAPSSVSLVDATVKGLVVPGPRPAGSTLDDDDLMCRFDRRFPGFAGARVDQKGKRLELFFADRLVRPEPRAVQAALMRHGFAVPGRPVVRRVRFGFCELKGWYDRLSKRALGLKGSVLSDIDEVRNDILIGVTDIAPWGSRVERIAKRLGVPRFLVRIEEVEPVRILLPVSAP